MSIRNITITAISLLLTIVLSTGCRHHREVVYVDGTQQPATNTVIYTNTPPPVNNTVVYTNNQPPPTPPVVSIVEPVTNFISPGNYITVRGNVQNILLAHQMNVSQNGYPIRFFSYDPFNGNFHFQTFLQPGPNNIIVTANNVFGTGSQGVTINYNPPGYVPNGGYNNGSYVNTNITPNGGNYPNNSLNSNVNVYTNGGNYPNNSINSNTNVTGTGGNYPNNSLNSNTNIMPAGGNYPNNSLNPNANINSVTTGGSYPNNSINANNNINGGNWQGKPFIQYTNPSSSPINISSSSYNVSATVMNVTNSSQISVNVNGAMVPTFNFNPNTHYLTFTAGNLLTGFNSVHISATNAVGTDAKSTVIDYRAAMGAPPRIEVFNPATSPFSSLQQNFIVSGYVYNVTSSAEITATFNGNPISFSYNQSTQEIEVPLNLSGSTNQLVIKANNSSGTDTKQVNLLFVTKNCSPSSGNTIAGNSNIQTGGVIQINNNTNNNTPHIGQNPNIQLGGAIQPNGNNTNNNTPHTGQQNPNLQTAGGVTYIDQNMNGNNNTPHAGQQNPNLQTAGGVTYIDQNINGNNNTPHTGQQNPNLQTGSGTIYIDQHNYNNANSGSSGTGATGQIGMHHAPEITRTSPASSPYTTMTGVISAAVNVNYVTSSSEVSVTYNGSPVSFSFNPQISEALNFTSPLSPGMNTFVVKATNSSGSATQDISINYVPTNTSGNANGNPNLHFQSGVNIASNTPRELNTNANQQHTEPAKINSATPINNAKPVQQNNTKQGIGIRPR